jgi:hypothetical protein
MVEITYLVDIKRMDQVIRKFFLEDTEKIMDEIVDRAANKARMDMLVNCPSSVKSGRGYRGKPLSSSIKMEAIHGGNGWLIGPTKKVDGYDLGTLLEQGSASHTKIVPRQKTAKEMEKDDRAVKNAHKGIKGYATPAGRDPYTNSYYRKQYMDMEGAPLGKRQRIYPRKSAFLYFTYQGRQYRARMVMRGSIPPMRFIERTSDQLREYIPELVETVCMEYLGANRPV